MFALSFVYDSGDFYCNSPALADLSWLAVLDEGDEAPAELQGGLVRSTVAGPLVIPLPLLAEYLTFKFISTRNGFNVFSILFCQWLLRSTLTLEKEN